MGDRQDFTPARRRWRGTILAAARQAGVQERGSPSITKLRVHCGDEVCSQLLRLDFIQLDDSLWGANRI
jgi:hypothetical protein